MNRKKRSRTAITGSLALVAALALTSLAPARVEYPAAQTLSTPGQNAGGARVAIDSHDRATVVWERSGTVQAVRLGADGTPGAVQTLSEPGQGFGFPQVAIDSQDRATVVWSRSDGTNERAQSIRLGADGAPGAVQTLSEEGQDAELPQVAVDSQGRATVVWVRLQAEAGPQIQAVRLGADGTPGAVQTLSEASPVFQGANNPQVAVDSQGRATVVWTRFDGTNVRVQSVRLGADGASGEVQNLSAAGQNGESPQVAIDSRDRATAVWTRVDVTPSRIKSVRLGADGAPSAVQRLSPVGRDAFDPQVALDSRDRATVAWVWRRPLSGRNEFRVQAIRIGADGVPGGVQTLSVAAPDVTEDPISSPQVAVDSRDRPTVAWSRFDGENFRVQATRGAIVAELELAGKKLQRLGKAVKVKASCDEDCTARATGRLKIKRGAGSAGAAAGPGALRLKRARAEIAAGETATLKPRIRRKGRRRARRALRQGKKVVAKLKVVATDADGNVRTARRNVKLRR